MFTFDFETQAIAPRPAYPPAPVGLASHSARGKTIYIDWAHPDSERPASALVAEELLRAHWAKPMLCHNAAFDIAVAHEKMGLPLPRGDTVNDTMFLAFLLDPYGELSLKPLAERYLRMPPAERDAVRDWLKANYKMPTGRRPTDKQCGALISQAPAALVAPYAKGDVDRTKALYEHMLPIVKDRGMHEAYRRECDILPMLIDNSAQGIPLDYKRLARDTQEFERLFEVVETSLRSWWERDIGGTPPGNFDAGDELAECLQRNPKIVLPLTPTGKVSTAKEALMDALPICAVKGLLLYRSALEKCLSTYMRPWRNQGKALHANWNQVRDYSDNGARTGRISSSPNLQNMTNPEKYEELRTFMGTCGCGNEWVRFPNLRSYIVAPRGMTLFSRDYSQQEFRMLAHFEDTILAQAYRDDPATDLHVFVAHLIARVTGLVIARKPTKTINFGKIYGMGAKLLAKKLGVDYDRALRALQAYDTALPSVGALMREISGLGKRGECIVTRGGRKYYAPMAGMMDGRIVTYEYRLLNYLIQGSAADQTKEAMRLWWQNRLRTATNGTRFLLTVHDQLVGCAPKKDARSESRILDEIMCAALPLDVPMKTDPTYGANFGEMK